MYVLSLCACVTFSCGFPCMYLYVGVCMGVSWCVPVSGCVHACVCPCEQIPCEGCVYMSAVTCSCAFKCSSMCLVLSVDLFLPTSISKASFLLRFPSLSRHPCSKRHILAHPDPSPMSFRSSCPTEPRWEGEPRFHFSQNCSRALSLAAGESPVAVITANYPHNLRR